MLMTSRRIKMCKDKFTFTNLKAAEAVGKKWGQNAYECPVCFCFHLTSIPDWKSEYVPRYELERIKINHEKKMKLLKEAERLNIKYREEIKRLKALNLKIHERLNGT